ncbi:fibronectin type III domain-containing protein [Membranicola marinus]|uniref:Fibronectin type III domain-containing protein n=1 Tax=Membranihabitans marinus TaxID=1227546 RepID=A0A953HUA5_9BACT|nr:fibronectin type III domain-containing protein [Membranihabitans marinus]MBY5956581.1 fibronectin type III domain-containing protein [Membranihabitans marinus]
MASYLNALSSRCLLRLSFVAIFCISLIPIAESQEEPLALYLTWKKDPTTTMVIDWHELTAPSATPIVHYKKANEDKEWQTTTAVALDFPHSDRTILRKELTGLQPDTRYAFRIGEYNRTYYFRTMPTAIDREPLLFVVGGDTFDRGHEARKIWMERTNKLILQYHPHFIFWGGDLAYADGKPDEVWRWYEWFDAIKNTLIDDDGNVIPIVVTIGNHETNQSIGNLDEKYWDNDSTRQAIAPFFYQLLAFPGQPGYRALDFGDYLTIIALDSDHSNRIDGEQTKWLKKTLRQRKNRPHVFPAYHVPGYPSVKPFDQKTSMRVRKYWTPLFDRYHVPMAFEFHDHVYKRTPRIKANKVDPDGTLYIGDGGWGTQLKAPKSTDTLWYIDKIVRERNAVLVSLFQEKSYIRAINEFGQVIDEYPPLFSSPSLTHPISTLMTKGGITLSAELATRNGPVYIDSDFTGYSQQGFAWFDHTFGDKATLTWTVPAHHSDDYTLRFRYSHPGPDTGHLELWINDQKLKEPLTFLATEKENRWKKSVLINTFFKKGTNRIELRSVDGKKAPRIDRLEVFPAVH